MEDTPVVVQSRILLIFRERKAARANVAKDYSIRLKCPYGDEDKWVALQNREETLEQILSSAWDFECPLHGVQREIPMEASEKGLSLDPMPQRRGLTEPSGVKGGQRRSKRLSLRVPVLVYGRARNKSAFREQTSTLVVNATRTPVAFTTSVDVCSRKALLFLARP